MTFLDLNFLQDWPTSKGQSLKTLADEKPVMLVFLRHFGCTFCRESMAELAKRRKEIEKSGAELVLVHMSDYPLAEDYFKKYKLTGVTHVSDPETILYTVFGLKKGTFNQLFGLNTWLRGFKAGVIDGHGIGWLQGDSFQMPGVFVIHKGEVKDRYIHKVVSDRPEYDMLLASCCNI
jgi:peroxiredoxin